VTIAVNPELARERRENAAAGSPPPSPLPRHRLNEGSGCTRTGVGPAGEAIRWHVYELPVGTAVALEDLTPDGYIAVDEEIARPLDRPSAAVESAEYGDDRRLWQALEVAWGVALLRQAPWMVGDLERARLIRDGYGGFSYVFEVQDGRTVVVTSTPQPSITGGDGRWPSLYPRVAHWLCLPSPSGPEVHRVT
jgi:hypothetical protein